MIMMIRMIKLMITLIVATGISVIMIMNIGIMMTSMLILMIVSVVMIIHRERKNTFRTGLDSSSDLKAKLLSVSVLSSDEESQLTRNVMLKYSFLMAFISHSTDSI